MFFDARHQALAQRCQQLQDRSALLRGRLAEDAEVLRTPLALADQVRQGWRWLKTHPQWVGVGVAVLVVWQPRRLAWVAARLLAGWRVWKRLNRWRSALPPSALELLGTVIGPLAARAISRRSASRPPG